jgi:phosphoserine phosphatase RsbU/P
MFLSFLLNTFGYQVVSGGSPMKSNLAFALTCLAIIILCAGAFFLLYREVHPLGRVQVSVDADSAGRKAVSIIREIFPDLPVSRREASLGKNDDLIRGVLTAFGRKQGEEALRAEIPGYFWDVRLRRPDAETVRFVMNDERRPGDRDSPRRFVEEIRIHLSTAGELVEYEWNVHDTATIAPAAVDSSRTVAEAFVRRHFAHAGGWTFTGEKKIERVHRTDVEYTWQGKMVSLDQPAALRIKVSGNKVLSGVKTYPGFSDVPESGESKVHGIVIALLIVGLAVLVIVVAFRRSRAYEMSFRRGIILGIFLAIVLAVEIYARMSDEEGWQTLFAVLIGPMFFGGAFVLLWSVAESVAREAWPRKFTAFDLLMKGHFLHSRVGQSVLQGLALGTAACLVWALLQFAGRSIVPSLFTPADGEILSDLTGPGAPFILMGQALTGNAYLFTALLFFLVSLLRIRSHANILLVVAGAVALGIGNKGGTMPLAAGIGISTLTAFVLSWGFYKLDVLSSIVGFATMTLVMVLPAFFTIGSGSIAQSGYLIASGLACVACFGLVSMLTSDKSIDLEAITPAFVKHITERERLQRELEIARDVQMSFLPRRDPEIPGVDIASRCVPALEVGGDYYDFVTLGPDRFGVVVGDVSGKGTQAAFYMTLTKGFLKAVTRASHSPAEVLTNLNDLFYENVERGTFISMVYGVFDLQRRTVTIARAGHNPPLFRRGGKQNMEFVQPAGLALGLEKGPAFATTIREFSSDLCSGNLLVFYTDGFTESMNRQNEEYGEERLKRSVEKYAAGTATEIVNGILADVQAHAGKAKQHDDMTIVVVKL